MSSAYKRHGQILGHALIERLKECARLEVWSEDNFKLSLASAEAVRKGLPLHAYRGIDLPYGDSLQTVRVDAIVFDRVSGLLRSYNVKRGNGSYDAGKRRLMLDELLRVQTLLRAYGEDVGLSVIKAEAYAIFYYGLFSVPSPYSLSREHLDEHFQFEVAAAVEAVNESFKARLHALIKGY